MSPDFLCIGAQKAGTTWLYDQLRQLSPLAVTPIKELHYFDRDPSYLSPNTAAITKFRSRSLDWRWYGRVAKDIGRTIRDRGTFEDFLFLWRWHSMDYSDQSYRKLFEEWETSKIRGEITPSYSILRQADVERIRQVNREIRIVFMLRDPIDRSWSHCRYYKPDVTYSTEALIDFIDGDEHTLRSDYLTTIDTYTSVFPKEQILLAFFDGISADPRRLLTEITQFLGAKDLDLSGLDTLSKKSNASKRLEIPSAVYRHLQSKHEKQIRKLAHDYGSFANQWLATHFDEAGDPNSGAFTVHPK